VVSIDAINWSDVDSDLDALRDDPRYQAMLAKARARLSRAG